MVSLYGLEGLGFRVEGLGLGTQLITTQLEVSLNLDPKR